MSIIVTGAAGFIGSNLVKALNRRGERDIIAVDDLTDGDKCRNLADCDIADYFDKREFVERFATHQLGELAANGEPETGAAKAAGGRGVGLFKAAEKAGNLVGFDTDAGIFDLKAQHHLPAAPFGDAGAQQDMTFFSKFDGVGEVIEQNLLEPHRVAANGAR